MKEFAVGDHVFCWCSFLGVPFAFQQHGIVIDVVEDGSIVILKFDHQHDDDINTNVVDNKGDAKRKDSKHDNGVDCKPQESGMTTPEERQQSQLQDVQRSESSVSSMSLSLSKPPKYCSMTPQRISMVEAQTKWEHVQYSQDWHHRILARAGTCSPATPDPRPVVLCRIQFLQQHQQEFIATLSYHDYKRNGECIAVWCQTGDYRSFQGSAKMGEAGMHVGSFSLVGGMAAQVVTSAVLPVLLPFMAAYDVGQAIVSVKDLHEARTEWAERTTLWNERFHTYMLEHYRDNAQQTVKSDPEKNHNSIQF